MKTTRVIIADDHPISLEGIRATLATAPEIEIVGEARDGEQAWALVESRTADVALLDIRLPGIDGLEVARRISVQPRPTPFLFLSMWLDEAIFNEAMHLGCSGYLLKECAAEEVVKAIRTVAEGRPYLSPAVTDFMTRREERQAAITSEQPGLAVLSAAERRVLALVAANRTSREIAEALELSHRTVENHRSNIAKKLGLEGSHSLLRFAFENRQYL